jgi:uncharacterized protein DUF6200
MAAPTRPTDSENMIQTHSAVAAKHAPVVLDLGKRRRKQIRQLRRGSGKLLDDVNSAVEELRTAGTLSADAQPVIVVVRQRRRRGRGGLLPRL